MLTGSSTAYLPPCVRPVRTLCLLSGLLLGACGGGSGDSNGPRVGTEACTVGPQNDWVYANMRDDYLFYDQVPVVDPATFESPRALIRALRFDERDPFSYIANASTNELEFVQGREFGIGFFWRFDDQMAVRVETVYDDSVFGMAGIERGDILLSINGRDAAELLQDRNEYNTEVLGTPDSPLSSEWRIQKRDTAEIITRQFTAREYAINTVVKQQILTRDNSGTRVGYLVFDRFLASSADELDAAFTRFAEEGIDELVLDLRYNRGGFISIATQLASLIAGDRNGGSLLYRYGFNNQNTDRNFDLLLLNGVGDPGLNRVLILTGEFTASSSEIVIAGLQPYVEVVTLGDRTLGKPYIQYARDRCSDRLFMVEAEGVNANGVSVFGGIAASCAASDDPAQDYGVNASTGAVEGMLASALAYIDDGDCDPVVEMASRRTRVDDLATLPGQRANQVAGAIGSPFR